MVYAVFRYKEQWIPYLKLDMALKALETFPETDILEKYGYEQYLQFLEEKRLLFDIFIPNLRTRLSKLISKRVFGEEPTRDILLFNKNFWFLKFGITKTINFEVFGEEYTVPPPYVNIGVKLNSEVVCEIYLKEGQLYQLLIMYYYGKKLIQNLQKEQQPSDNQS